MQVVSVNVGIARTAEINGRKVLTGYAKRAVDGPVDVRPLGLAGDEQADPSVHGGLSKAVYAYPVEHYAFWQTVRAQAGVSLWDDALPHGALGENLTMTGLLETAAWVGDVLRFPDCDLAVSEPRFPCFKFDAAMGFKQATKMMVQSAWCGYYLCVRKPGSVRAGETFSVVPGPREVSIVEIFRARRPAHGPAGPK